METEIVLLKQPLQIANTSLYIYFNNQFNILIGCFSFVGIPLSLHSWSGFFVIFPTKICYGLQFNGEQSHQKK